MLKYLLSHLEQNGKQTSINVPSEKDGTFCHLNLNFRSHDGVLLLAASVVELL